MRKNCITQDTPYYHSDEEEKDAIANGLAQEDKDPDAVGSFGEQ